MINHHPLFPYPPVQVQSSLSTTTNTNGNNQLTITSKSSKIQTPAVQQSPKQIIGKVCLSTYYETKLNSLTITIFRCHLNSIKKHKNDL